MPLTPDRFPGVREEQELKLDPESSDPTSVGAMRIVSGDFRLRDNVGVFNPRLVDVADHEGIDSLVHLLAESRFTEITRSAGRVTDVIDWTDAGKTVKVREVNITRTAGKVSQVVLKHYDASGTIISGQTLTGAINRVSGKVADITWVES